MAINLKELLSEVAEMESAFKSKLERLGNSELASDYSDITTIRKTYEILSNKQLARPLPAITASRASSLHINQRNAEVVKESIGVTDAARSVIRALGNSDFTVNDITSKLIEAYPLLMSTRNKTHVSATLSNLASANEIDRLVEGKGGEPSVYRAKQPTTKGQDSLAT